MEAPKFRENHKEDQYRIYVKRTPIYTWLNAELDSLTENEKGVIFMSGTWTLKDGADTVINSGLRDRWIKENDGKWYHALYNPLFFPINYGERHSESDEQGIKNKEQ